MFKNKSIYRFKSINRFEYFKLHINKDARHVFYLQFTINVFQVYFLISVNEVTLTMIYKIFVKRTLLFVLGARFLVYLTDVLGGRS